MGRGFNNKSISNKINKGVVKAAQFNDKSSGGDVRRRYGSVFNGGNPLKFRAAIRKINQMFQEHEITNFMQFNTADDPNLIEELTFELIEPNENDQVHVPYQDKIARNDQARDDMFAAIEAEAGLENMQRATMRLQTIQKHRDNLLTIENGQQDMIRRFEDNQRHYRKEREKFTKFRAKCMAVLQVALGDSVLDLVKDELAQERYRRAWAKLHRHFVHTNNGTSSVAVVMDQINSMVFDSSKTQYSVHMEELSTMYEQVEGYDGLPMSDTFKLMNLMRSLENSPQKQFKEELTHVKMNNKSYAEACEQFQRRACEIESMSSSQLNKQKDEVRAIAAVAASAAGRGGRGAGGAGGRGGRQGRGPGVGQGRGGKGGRVGSVYNNGSSSSNDNVCVYCNKYGHSVLSCFSYPGCAKCGSKGHLVGYCRNVVGNNAVSLEPSPHVEGHANRFVNNASKYLHSFFVDQSYTCIGENASRIPDKIGKVICNDAMNLTMVRSEVESSGDITSTIVVPLRCSVLETQSLVPDQHIEGYLMSMLQVVLASDTQTSRRTIRVIIDSGATSHMTPYMSMLRGVRRAEGLVHLGKDGMTLDIVGMGGTSMLDLGDVLYVPELTFAIISVPTLDKQQCSILFENQKATVYNSIYCVILTATLVDGLYYVDDVYIRMLFATVGEGRSKSAGAHLSEVSQRLSETKRISSHADGYCVRKETPEDLNVLCNESATLKGGSCASYGLSDDTMQVTDSIVDMNFSSVVPLHSSYICQGRTSKSGQDVLDELHRKWGHMGEYAIKRLLRLGLVSGCIYVYSDVKDANMSVCYDCLQGRMKAQPSDPTTDHDWRPMEKIGIDFKGYFAVMSYHHYKGFMLMCDYNTNYVYVALVKSKSEHVAVLDKFLREEVLYRGYSMKVLQSDSESIFKSKAVEQWLSKNNIKLQLSAPYMHWQNGQVEVYVGIIMDKARTMMCSYNVPQRFWEFAIVMAVHIVNMFPGKNKNESAYELLNHVKPDVSRLVPFYAPGVFHVTKEERRDTWSPKAEPCRMLGYSKQHLNTYIILRISTGQVLCRSNCVFDSMISETDLDSVKYDTSDDYGDNSIIFDEVDEPECDVFADKSEYDDNDNNVYKDLDEPYWESDAYIAIDSLERWYNEVVFMVHKPIQLPPNPKSVEEALAGPDSAKWRTAITKECDQFRSRSIWGEAEQTGRGMKTKLILKYQYDGEYNVVCKARLVVCGYSQVKGIDYDDTYSPTTTSAIIFLLLHLATNKRLFVNTFDISGAYLEGKADHKMYAWLPAELSALEKKVRVEILGNWYGEKQAGKIWNDLFHSVLTKLNFVQCPVFPCLYMWTDSVDVVFLTIHVDDGLFVSSNVSLADEFMVGILQYIRKAVLYKDFKKYVGLDIDVNADRSCIIVSQTRYIEDKIVGDGRVYRTPMAINEHLRSEEPNSNNESLLPSTGKFRWLADKTRPDILVAAGEISSGGAVSPSDKHVVASDRLKNYLLTTKHYNITFDGRDEVKLFGYSDAAYITAGKSRSRLGGCLFLGLFSAAILCFSVMDNLVSHSSTEAEIKAIDKLCREIVYMREVLKFVGYEQKEPTVVYVDNKSAIELCKTLKVTHKTKHINMRINYIRECINAGTVILVFVPSELNVADELTKSLVREAHDRHVDILLHGHNGVCPADIKGGSLAFADVPEVL